jgi:hypothetical protein
VLSSQWKLSTGVDTTGHTQEQVKEQVPDIQMSERIIESKRINQYSSLSTKFHIIYHQVLNRLQKQTIINLKSHISTELLIAAQCQLIQFIHHAIVTHSSSHPNSKFSPYKTISNIEQQQVSIATRKQSYTQLPSHSKALNASAIRKLGGINRQTQLYTKIADFIR